MQRQLKNTKAYTKQLENEVGKWHHAYDALMVERNALVNKLMATEKILQRLQMKNATDGVNALWNSKGKLNN